MYFFTPIRKKHSGDSRIDRLTKEGYWRASQSSSMVLDRKGNKIGTKRPLVYYVNDRTQKGIKTNWLMNEYMLINQSHNLAVCWIHQTKLKENERRNYLGTSSCSNVNPSDQIDLILPDNLDFPIPISYHNLSQEVEVHLMANDYPNYEDHACTVENLLDEERVVPMTNDCPNDHTCTKDLFDEDMGNFVAEIEDFLDKDMDNFLAENYSNTMEDLLDEEMDNLMAEISNHNAQTYTLEDLLEYTHQGLDVI